MHFRGAWLLFLPCAFAANLPTFTYSFSEAQINGIATDAAGNTYIAGTTFDGTIDTTPGAFQTQPTAASVCGFVATFGTPVFCNDSFVVKLDPTGAVVFATYLGGNGDTSANAIAVDQQGNVYVAGTTSAGISSTNTFPVTPGAAFTNFTRGSGFITKLNPSGSQLVYSTFVPGASISTLVLGIDGNAYVAGPGSPSSFPTMAGAFQISPKGGSSSFPGFVAKLNASGSALVYATYLSGSGASSGGEYPMSVAVDAMGDAFITGWTNSTDFPVTSGAFLTTSPAPRSIFLTKLNPQGNGLVYSTYLAAVGYGSAVKLDAQGTAFVAGSTGSGNFPTTPGGMTRGSGVLSGFLTRFSADGSSLIYSTYVPAESFPLGTLDVDSAGNAAVAGATAERNLPVRVGAFQPEYGGGNSDVYIAKFTPEGHLAASTYLGGPKDDSASLIALDPNGSVVVAGFASVTSIFPSLTVLNEGSYVASQIAPGELVSLLGYGIGPTTGVGASGPSLPNQLAGVQVSFGGFAAPLLYVQSHVINAQVPWELAGQTSTTVRISYPGVASADTPVLLARSLPGIFGVRNSDGTLNSPSNPAKPGDFIVIYGTGGGPTSPAGVTGALWTLTTPLPTLTLKVSVTIGGENASVLYAGASPQSSSGIFQINVLLPSDLPPSATASLNLTIGNASSPAIPVAIGTR
jgi:uncharacterized protein (TIGR03437 family)